MQPIFNTTLEAVLKLLYFVIGYTVTIWGGGWFVGEVCRSLKPPGEEEDENEDIQHAERMIGYFERVILLTLVLLNQYVAIGLVLTAKSIARFKALDDRKSAQHYLAGTLASTAVALIIGLAMILAKPTLSLYLVRILR